MNSPSVANQGDVRTYLVKMDEPAEQLVDNALCIGPGVHADTISFERANQCLGLVIRSRVDGWDVCGIASIPQAKALLSASSVAAAVTVEPCDQFEHAVHLLAEMLDPGLLLNPGRPSHRCHVLPHLVVAAVSEKAPPTFLPFPAVMLTRWRTSGCCVARRRARMSAARRPSLFFKH